MATPRRPLVSRIAVASLLASLAAGAWAQPASLVRDINAGATGSDPRELTDVNGILFFSADDGLGGRELWKSNGTLAGTTLVRDINPITITEGPEQLTNLNGVLIYAGYRADTGREIWRSDGTSGGTVLLRDVTPGVNAIGPSELTQAFGFVYFGGDDINFGRELWRSDGSAFGTFRVVDLNPGTASSNPRFFTPFANAVYFFAENGTGTQLYRSQGAAVNTTAMDSPLGTPIAMAAALNGLYYMTLESGAPDIIRVYHSNGTAGTQQLLVQFNRDAVSTPATYEMEGVQSRMFFTAGSDTVGHELWTSDGTPAGTVAIDIEPGIDGSIPTQLTATNSFLLFTASTAAAGRELWRSEGTGGTTVLVRDLAGGSLGSNPLALFGTGSGALFNADVGGTRELWRTNGLPFTTVLVQDIPDPGIGNISQPEQFTISNGLVFFTAAGTGTGRELWAGTVDDILPVATESAGWAEYE